MKAFIKDLVIRRRGSSRSSPSVCVAINPHPEVPCSQDLSPLSCEKGAPQLTTKKPDASQTQGFSPALDPPQPSSNPPHYFDVQPHGLFVLYPTAEAYVESSALEVEYVAVPPRLGFQEK